MFKIGMYMKTSMYLIFFLSFCQFFVVLFDKKIVLLFIMNYYLKLVTVRVDITVFRGTFKFENFYFNYNIEANQVNFSTYYRFKLRTLGVHYSVPPNVHLNTVLPLLNIVCTCTCVFSTFVNWWQRFSVSHLMTVLVLNICRFVRLYNCFLLPLDPFNVNWHPK